MARQDIGKAVSRVGATGGGRSYRAHVPYRWYGSLVLIVLLGIFLVVYSRYERQHITAAPTAAPTTSDHWVAGLTFDLCGKTQQVLAANPNYLTDNLGIYSSGKGVLVVAPKTSADAGQNATIGRFAQSYPKLTLTSDSVGLPKGKVYTDGEKCPSGSPDHGKSGKLEAQVWQTATSNSPTSTTDVLGVHFSQSTQLVAIAFVPAGASVPRPDGTIVLAVLDASSSSSSTSTTATTSATTSTTAVSSTTSTTR